MQIIAGVWEIWGVKQESGHLRCHNVVALSCTDILTLQVLQGTALIIIGYDMYCMHL